MATTFGLPDSDRGQTRITITGLARQAMLTGLAGFLSALNATAEQWTDGERPRVILARGRSPHSCA